MRKVSGVVCVSLLGAAVSLAALREVKPGWNLFSKQQDVQLGHEAAQQVHQQMQVVRNPELTNYVSEIGRRIVNNPKADQYPYTFEVVADPAINAFSLPGGPVFINTGLIAAADNEAQLAGVIAHETSHVALRHATNQASKANLIQLPAMLAGALSGGSMLGQLAQLGIGLGANSVLLKFSRNAESQADYLGAQLMADAGYNPIEMARFFEKLEAQSGRSSHVAQFLSDHPNPGNRVRAVEDEIQQMPRRNYTTDTGRFQNMRDLVMHTPGPRQLRSPYRDQHPEQPPSVRPTGRFREFRGNSFAFSYPDNWQVFGDQQGNMVTIAPPDAVMQNPNGGVAVGYGLMVSYYQPQTDRLDLERDTADLVNQFRSSNRGMQVGERRAVTAGGQRALLTTLYSQSPYQGEQEVDALVTVPRPEGLFYLIFIAPRSEFQNVQGVFDQVLRSLRF